MPSSDGTLQEVSDEKVSRIELPAVVIVDVIESLRVGIGGANVKGICLRLSIGGGIGGGYCREGKERCENCGVELHDATCSGAVK